ncbi:MAG TPA: 16S rRNA (guanine(966)-N(2))-methyltransferase RsmD [Acidobacteriaceae bacterium]
MRVIAGEYRRRTLIAPRGMATRPTSDRLRETLFNVLAPRLEGARFLDLYAGSGANGIEALSRGASRVVFVERAAAAIAAIRENLAALQVPAGRYAVEGRAVGAWLRFAMDKMQGIAPGAPLSEAWRGFEVVFLDPPYDLAVEYETTLELLGGESGALLAPGGVVVAEHRRARRGGLVGGPGERCGLLKRTRVLEQGDATLSFYEA